MNINNVTDNDIFFDNLGFTLKALESKNLRDISDFYSLSNYLDELVQPMLDGFVTFSDDNSTFTTIASISSFLNTGITKIDITQSEDNEALDVTIVNDINTYTSNDYYYFQKSVDLLPNQQYVIEFKGYLNEAIIDLKSGNITADLNLMGDIELKDYTHFEFSIDYKLKDPVLTIKCSKISSFGIFIEGIYVDDIKSKSQYLEELNAVEPEIDVPITEDEKRLQFSVDFQTDIDDEVFIDSINNDFGKIINVPLYTNKTFLDEKTYINFGEIQNINIDKDYTFSVWFKPLSHNNNILLFNKNEYKLEIRNNALYFKGHNSRTFKITNIEDTELDNFHNITIVFSNKKWTIFYDGLFIFNTHIKPRAFRSSDLMIGTKKVPLSNIALGKYKIYNFAFSESMVRYLINTQNPDITDNIENNFENGIRYNYYDASSISSAPNNNYNFTILEKKYCNQKYLNKIVAQDVIDLDSNISAENIIIHEGYIYLDYIGLYTFELTSNGSAELIMDDESIISVFNMSGDYSASNTNTNVKFLSQGYHKFKMRYYGKQEKIELKMASPDATLNNVASDKLFRKIISQGIGLFGMTNAVPYGCSFDEEFDDIKAELISTDDYDYYNIKNLKTLRFKDMNNFNHQHIFTFNYWIETSAGYNYIFSIGNKNYTDYLSGYSYRTNMRNAYESVRITTNNIDLNKWTMITVTGNGTTLTYYKNGVEVGTTTQKNNSYYEYDNMFVNFGTVSSGTPLGYVRYTNFKISEWFYDEVLYSKTELLSIYKQGGEKYGV